MPTELHVYRGAIHGGFGARPATPRTAQFLHDVYGALAAAFIPAWRASIVNPTDALRLE